MNLAYKINVSQVHFSTEKKGEIAIANAKQSTNMDPTLVFPFQSVIEKPSV